jgi:hypothetical protein
VKLYWRGELIKVHPVVAPGRRHTDPADLPAEVSVCAMRDLNALRVSPRLEPFKTAIDSMLRSDLDAPRKQRHAARRVLARLVDEHGAVGFSYSTVRDYVRKRRPQILAEAGRPLELGYVPQTHKTAASAEVDFHDLWVVLGCHSSL